MKRHSPGWKCRWPSRATVPGTSPPRITIDFRYGRFTRVIPSTDQDREPSGYRDWLRRQEPIVLWDDGAHRPRLETEADWIKAGEIVFDAPVIFFPGLTSTAQESRDFDAQDRRFQRQTGHQPVRGLCHSGTGEGRDRRGVLPGMPHPPHARQHSDQGRSGESPCGAGGFPWPCQGRCAGR